MTLLILLIRQLIKLFNERKDIIINRITNFVLTTIIFCLTLYNFNKLPNRLIEKLDWTIFYNKRNKVINEVLSGNLKPNSEMNNGICELPFDFPIISNGGNDIWISENKDNKSTTIKFWISRGFFESPQTYFIFTNDNESKKYYQELITSKPEFNRKLEENWYRIMERE